MVGRGGSWVLLDPFYQVIQPAQVRLPLLHTLIWIRHQLLFIFISESTYYSSPSPSEYLYLCKYLSYFSA